MDRRDSRHGPAYRDRRERSPERRPRDTHRSHDYRGSTEHRERESRGDRRSHHDGAKEQLPPLPRTAPIPASGCEVDYKSLGTVGQAGKAVMVRVNHFKIQSLPTIRIYAYGVAFRFDEQQSSRNREFSASLRAKVFAEFVKMQSAGIVFDGISTAWSTQKLCSAEQPLVATTTLPASSGTISLIAQIRLHLIGRLDIKALVEHLLHTGPGSELTADIRACFDWLTATFREAPVNEFISHPRSSAFFARLPVPKLVHELASTGGILEAVRGIYQSVTFQFGVLSLNVDTACAAFVKPHISMLDVARAFANLSWQERLEDVPFPVLREQCAQMVGMFFNIQHQGKARAHRKIRVQEISRGDAVSTSFSQHDEKTGADMEMTVLDYFKKRYSIHLRHPHLPLLKTNLGLSPMERCTTAPGERWKEPLQGAQTADFIGWATSPAYTRETQILENVNRLKWHEQTKPQGMGLSVATSPLRLPARILPTPTPIYAPGSDSAIAENGSWNLRGKKFVQPATFQSWGLLYFPSRIKIRDQELQSFCAEFCRAMGNAGLKTPRGPHSFLRGNANGDIAQAVNDLYSRVGNDFPRPPDLLIFLVHSYNASKALYKAIKVVCDTKLGIASQVMIVEKSVKSKSQAQYLGNIALKINVKLGGINSYSRNPMLRSKKFMMMGGDTSHPSPAERRRPTAPPTFAALVGTYDRDCVKYSAISFAQQAGQELMDGGSFEAMAKELLKRFQRAAGSFPDAVVYWRDGISDDQVGALLNTEVRALQRVRDSGGHSFKITVVNCIKRHHTRMFPEGRGDRHGNVCPGTVIEARVDSGKDVFIVTQAALQGTCRPCHYTVVLDENNLTADEFQQLIMDGCWSYARATRSVSIHPAVYYADQVCTRARLHMHGEDGTATAQVHDRLTNTMYWQ